MKDKYIKSKFIVPFIMGNKPDIDHSKWTNIKTETKYLSKYVAEIFNPENEIFNRYELKESYYDEIDLSKSIDAVYMMNTKKDELHFNFYVSNIEILYFATKIGFLLLEISYEENIGLKDMCDISAALSYMFSEAGKYWGYRCREKDIHLPFIIERLVEEFSGGKVEWFPASENKKSYIFHQVLSKIKREDDKQMVYRLMKGWGGISSVELKEEQLDDFIWKAAEDRLWGIDSNGVVSFSYDLNDSYFIRETYQRNVGTDYFMAFILALHERETLLRYNYEVVKNWKDTSQLIRIKENLVRFDTWFSYNSISVEAVYQEFYENVYRVLKLDMLEEDVEEVVEKVDEFTNSRKDRRMNALLSSITMLAVISAVADGLALVDWIYSQDGVGIGHIICLVIIAIIILIGLWSFWRKG